jgi:glycosyltransferase involved in cell wall biosynthesis
MTLAAMRMRRVLLALPSRHFGGTELHTASLAQALVEHGLDVTLVCETALAARLRRAAPGVTLRVADIGWQAELDPAAARAAQGAALTPLLQDLRPDAVVLPLPWPDHGLGAMDAAAALPVMVISHLAPVAGELAALNGVEWPLGLPALAWVAVSDPVARRTERLFGMPRGTIRTILNGVEVPPPLTPAARTVSRARLRAELGLPQGVPVALFAGRLVEAKGADRLPDIAKHFHAACGGVIACAGEGPLRPRLAAAGPGLLRLLGYRQDVGYLLTAADALVLPSRLEGLPLIYLEAAMRQTPVVASRSALACFGETADERALVVSDDDLAGFGAALVRAARADNTAAILDCAWRRGAAHDRAAMHAAHLAVLLGLHALHGKVC